MTKYKKIFLTVIAVLMIVPCFSVLSFANDNRRVEDAIVLGGSSNIEAITLVLDDGYGDDSGIPDTNIVIDYAHLISRSFSTQFGNSIQFETNEFYPIDGVDYQVIYNVNVRVNYVTGYAKGSKYCALKFTCDAYGRADPSEDPDLRLLYSLPIKEIVLSYKLHTIHKYSTEFLRPYDGNIDATIGVTGAVEWTSNLVYNTVGFDYVQYRYTNTDLGRNLSYYRIKDDMNSFQKRFASDSATNPNYIPIGVRYNYSDVNMNTIQKYVDNVLQPHVNQDDKYIYSLCINATQTITFDEGYTGDFTITDMFSPVYKNTTDVKFLDDVGQIYTDNIEIGTFLRNSVDNFLEFEILDGYSLSDLLWTIVGICAVFALFFLLLGR